MSNSDSMRLKMIRTRRNALRMGGVLATAAVTMLAFSRKGMADPGNGNGWGQGDGGGKDHKAAQCLLKGTNITTASGDRKVEELAIGDLVMTMHGGMGPIQWVGRCLVKKGDPSWAKSLPIHFAPSAIGPGVPNMKV